MHGTDTVGRMETRNRINVEPGNGVTADDILGHDDLIFRFTDSADRNQKKKITFKAIEHVTGSCTCT